MVAIASLLIVLTLSLIITRVATMALVLTGMSRESARFQARSAFTGVGFTTSEAEDVVGHPVRRRIVMLLMLLGNLGLGAVVAALMLSFMDGPDSTSKTWPKLLALAGGLLALWGAASNRYLERRLNSVIAWVLGRWGKLNVRDYVAILQLQGGYAVSELVVGPKDWLAGKTLIELRLPSEGVLVLGVQRSGEPYHGAPAGDMRVLAGDTLIVYGPVNRIEELDQRRRGRQGDKAHLEASMGHEVVDREE